MQDSKEKDNIQKANWLWLGGLHMQAGIPFNMYPGTLPRA